MHPMGSENVHTLKLKEQKKAIWMLIFSFELKYKRDQLFKRNQNSAEKKKEESFIL